MNITFGMFLDGADWSSKAACLNEMACGPMGLLEYLEERLGLSGVTVSQAVRINEYRKKIKSSTPEWCRNSFALDEWNTASQMLAWRDELLLNGWQGGTPSPRLEALWILEQNGAPLSPGLPEKLQRVQQAAAAENFTGKITLTEPLELLPYPWKNLITLLKERGVTVAGPENVPEQQAEIFKVKGRDEWTLAVECARYLSAGDNSRTAVICEQDSASIDGVLHRFGFGSLGVKQASRWHSALQLLPLWLEQLWKPFDAQLFQELLSLPRSPIPADARYELAGAVREAPGLGSDRWEHAWEKIFEKIRANENNSRKDPAASLEKFRKLKAMLENERFDPAVGVPENILKKRCDLFIQKYAPQITDHPVLAAAVNHAKLLKDLTEGCGIINRITLKRMVSLIIGNGICTENTRQVNLFALFTHPGMIRQDFDTIVWWNFTDSGRTPGSIYTKEEQETAPGLKQRRTAELEAFAWKKAVRYSKRLILFIPEVINGNAVYPHPLNDELPDVSAAALCNAKGHWQLGDRSLDLTAADPFAPKIGLKLPTNDISPRRALSVTQMENFISCPFKWFLKDYAGLKKSSMLDASRDTILRGNLAHKVVELLFNEQKKWTPEAANQRSGELFEQLVPQMLSEMQREDQKINCERFKTQLLNAVETLVEKCNTENWTVIGTEVPFSGTFQGMEFCGKIDLLLEDSSGGKIIIDMKWSDSLSRYRDKIKNNTAFQLAAYAKFQPEGFRTPGGYFLMPVQQMLFSEESGRKQVCWELAEQTWNMRMTALHSGKLEFGENDEKNMKESLLPLKLTAYCQSCEFKALCGIVRGEEE